MSADRGDRDDTNLPIEDELALTGAAADSAESDDRLKALPRLLRYVVLGNREKSFAEERLVAEIVELAPDIPLASAWIGDGEARLGLALASELDHRAVTTDRPDLRRPRRLPPPDVPDAAEAKRKSGRIPPCGQIAASGQ